LVWGRAARKNKVRRVPTREKTKMGSGGKTKDGSLRELCGLELVGEKRGNSGPSKSPSTDCRKVSGGKNTPESCSKRE